MYGWMDRYIDRPLTPIPEGVRRSAPALHRGQAPLDQETSLSLSLSLTLSVSLSLSLSSGVRCRMPISLRDFRRKGDEHGLRGTCLTRTRADVSTSALVYTYVHVCVYIYIYIHRYVVI